MIEYFLLRYTRNGYTKWNLSISSSDLSKSHEVLQLPDEGKHDATGDSLVHALVRVSPWFVSFHLCQGTIRRVWFLGSDNGARQRDLQPHCFSVILISLLCRHCMLPKSIIHCGSIRLHWCLSGSRNGREIRQRFEKKKQTAKSTQELQVAPGLLSCLSLFLPPCVCQSSVWNQCSFLICWFSNTLMSLLFVCVQVLWPVCLVPRCHQTPSGRWICFQSEDLQQWTHWGLHL